MTAHLLTTRFNEHFKPTIEITPQKKKRLNNKILLNDNAPGQPRVLRGMYGEIHTVFMPANISILQLVDQGVILALRLIILRNIFCKFHR